MATITPMIEYLLALRTPYGGGQLVRFGGLQITIPIFPAGIEISWAIAPYYGSYCSIEYWHRFSPSIVPGSLYYNVSHSGIQLQVGTIGTTFSSESHNTWIEIFESDPISASISNISGLNQFFESNEAFLLIDNEANLEYTREVVRSWGAFESIGPKLDETNELLREMFGSDSGPRYPLAGRRQ